MTIRVEQSMHTLLKMYLNELLLKNQDDREVQIKDFFKFVRQLMNTQVLKPEKIILMFEELFESASPNDLK